jgi:aminoglycoside phosphotransferase (APT) family kinase protein
VLTPPRDLSEDMLAAALARGWGVGVDSMSYRPLGFGSHHWEVADTRGERWFLTVDELESKRGSRDEPPEQTFARLRASLRAARDLRDCGAAFAVAPVPARDGEPLLRLGQQFGVALYPFVTGQSFEWGEFADPAHRRGVLGLVVALHTAPAGARRHAATEDFVIAHRDELEAALGGAAGRATEVTAELGPHARPAAALLAENADPVRRLLARYDELAGRSRPAGMVLTHGETHPGNTMLTAEGWVLVDWDTAMVAPPERDLWSLDPGDGSVLRGYADATGVTPSQALLELYRIRWDLADLAVGVSRFGRHHPGSPDDDKSWDDLCSLVVRLAAGGHGDSR